MATVEKNGHDAKTEAAPPADNSAELLRQRLMMKREELEVDK